MATWFYVLSGLIYFQGTTATLAPVNLQYGPKCEGLRCHQQPQYKVLLPEYKVSQQPQYVLQPQLHQNIQQAEYQHPIVQVNPYPKCPYGHSIQTSQAYDLNDQHKLLQNAQHLHALLQYQNQEQKQHQGYRASYEQSKNLQEENYRNLYQQSANAYQQKNYESSYQQLGNGLQQNGYVAAHQSVNNVYLPPHLPQQQLSNDIYETAYQSLQKNSQNLISASQIRQELSDHQIQNSYESLRQQFNNAHLSSQIQQQHLLSANIQQNELVNNELSQEHHGKIKQTIKYDISHQHQGHNLNQGYSQHQGLLNSYSDAKSSTNIERHHDIHHHSDGNEGAEEYDHETGKKKKDHDAYYKFEYAVNDKHTGDIKNHKEERAGDEVRGEYSLVEEDGNVRTVKYFADWKTGFHATVHNSKPRN